MLFLSGLRVLESCPCRMLVVQCSEPSLRKRLTCTPTDLANITAFHVHVFIFVCALVCALVCVYVRATQYNDIFNSLFHFNFVCLIVVR